MTEQKRLSVTLTPRKLTEVEALEKEVNDYLGNVLTNSDELVSLLEQFLEEYEAAKAENEKLKELLKGMLGNPFMGNALAQVKEKLNATVSDTTDEERVD